MKVKALRHKESKEFIHIEKIGGIGGTYELYTSSIPKIQPATATIESMEQIFKNEKTEFLNFNDYELIEFGEVGADIRNKLTPPKTLVALLEMFFKENVAYVSEDRTELVKIIKKEMEQTKISVEYIADLL